jgi:hypothetical protein
MEDNYRSILWGKLYDRVYHTDSSISQVINLSSTYHTSNILLNILSNPPISNPSRIFEKHKLIIYYSPDICSHH